MSAGPGSDMGALCRLQLSGDCPVEPQRRLQTDFVAKTMLKSMEFLEF
jgi:hypothetical protein